MLVHLCRLLVYKNHLGQLATGDIDNNYDFTVVRKRSTSKTVHIAVGDLFLKRFLLETCK